MSTVTWNTSKDSRIAYRTSDGWEAGSGTSDGLPVGLYGSYRYRTLLGFSYSFSGMTSINSAVLHLRTSDQIHVSFGSDPDMEVRRLTQSWSEGSQNGLSSSNGVTWANQPSAVNADQANKDVTASEDTWITVTITGIIQAALAAGTFYGLRLSASNESAESDTTEFYSSEFSTGSDAYIVVDYETNVAPTVPTLTAPAVGAVVNTLTPTFTGTHNDPDGDTMSGFQIRVYRADAVTLHWDSGLVVGTGSTFSKVYNGPALTGDTSYWWQARTKDPSGLWGPYEVTQLFTPNSIPSAPTLALTQSPTTDVKTLTPTFNVTRVDADASDKMNGYHIILETSAGAAKWDSGDVTIAEATTKALVYAGPALTWQTGYRWRARTRDTNGAWGAYSANATFTTHTTGVPISLNPTGGAASSSITPTFAGSRATTADTLTTAQIEVYASNGTTLIWDSGTTSTGVTTSGFSRAYAGSALTGETTYKWRARVTSSVGGVSAWSAQQTFVTPSVLTPSITTPVGSGVTPVTNLNFTFTRASNFNDHELFIYSDAAGTTQVATDAPASYGATGSKTFVYSGTLAWNTTYYWKVRVSSDGGSNWSSFTSLITFTTDASGIPTITAPYDDALIGNAHVIDGFNDITGVTNGTSASASLETGAGLYETGIGSLKVAISSLNASATSFTYRTFSGLNLSQYGTLMPGSIRSRYSSSTNVSTMRLRFVFDTDADYVEYDIKPSTTGAFESKPYVKGTVVATGGTVNWANVTKIGVRVVATGGGSVTTNIYLDNLTIGAGNPSFNGTTFNAEVVSTFRILVFAADATTLVWDSGEIAGSGTTFAKLYSGTALSTGVVYYWQARYTKSTGPTGNYSPLSAFIMNSSPSVPTGLSPASGSIVSTVTPDFISTFNDPERDTLGDLPTMLTVQVHRTSDSVLAYTLMTKTDLAAGSNTIYDGLAGVVKVTGAAAPLTFETEYKYRTWYDDLMGSAGFPSSYVIFKPSEPPVVTISSPSHSSTVDSPSFTVSWGHTSPGSKAQNSYRVRVTRVWDDVDVVDTGQIFSSDASFVVPSGHVTNNLDYDITVWIWDVDQLISVADTNRITSSWTAPDAVQNFTVADDVSLSATVLRWEQSNLSGAVFRQYIIYRKLASDADWTILTTLTNQAQVLFYDYIAANTVNYQYMITQLQIIPGDVDLESPDSDIGSSMLDTDSWFVIGADRAEAHIFELPVTSAPFIEPVQQEVFEALGTNRKVIIRGKVMGAEGTLMAKWSTTERDVALAQVEYIKSTPGPHLLKSPFGDVWQVEFSGPNKEYVQGGHFNVTIVWTEVA